MTDVVGKCPLCSGDLTIQMRLEAKPLGTWSSAGGQIKVAASNWPWLVCSDCPFQEKGRLVEEDEPGVKVSQKIEYEYRPSRLLTVGLTMVGLGLLIQVLAYCFGGG